MAHGLPVRALGKQGLHASAQGLGCMSLTKGFYGGEGDVGPEAERLAVLKTALARGVTLLNTADFYGPHDNHVLIGTLVFDCLHDNSCCLQLLHNKLHLCTCNVWS